MGQDQNLTIASVSLAIVIHSYAFSVSLTLTLILILWGTSAGKSAQFSGVISSKTQCRYTISESHIFLLKLISRTIILFFLFTTRGQISMHEFLLRVCVFTLYQSSDGQRKVPFVCLFWFFSKMCGNWWKSTFV